MCRGYPIRPWNKFFCLYLSLWLYLYINLLYRVIFQPLCFDNSFLDGIFGGPFKSEGNTLRGLLGKTAGKSFSTFIIHSTLGNKYTYEQNVDLRNEASQSYKHTRRKNLNFHFINIFIRLWFFSLFNYISIHTYSCENVENGREKHPELFEVSTNSEAYSTRLSSRSVHLDVRLSCSSS